MSSVPVVGRQALYLQMLGEELATATCEGRAPNQPPTGMLPPELAPTARPPAGGSPDRPKFVSMAYGARLAGANSIAVRIVASLDRVKFPNAMAGEGGRPPFRPSDDPDGPRAGHPGFSQGHSDSGCSCR